MKKILFIFIAALLIIPNIVFAKSVDNLIQDDTLILPAVTATSYDEYYDFISNYLMRQSDVAMASPIGMPSDYTTANISVSYKDNTNATFNNISLVYAGGNETIHGKIKAFADGVEMGTTFALTDLETINYWVNAYGENERAVDVMANYSGELKRLMNKANVLISFITATGAGENGTFFEKALGDAVLFYDDVMYDNLPFVGCIAKSVIYVDDDATDLKAAAQERIDAYIGEGVVTISEGGTVASLIPNAQEREAEFDQEHLNMVAPDNYFIATVNNHAHPILIIKDSSKMTDAPVYETKDLNTEIEINSTDSSIPLDTFIKAKKITSGELYNTIVKALNSNNIETYDLSLYSNTLSDYVRELEDGTFEVKIPISNNFKGKDNLVVYYVDENGKKEEYEVRITDNGKYATFVTDHFSTYTLTEKGSTEASTTDNPKTSDKVGLDVLLLLTGILGLSSLSVIYKKKKLS